MLTKEDREEINKLYEDESLGKISREELNRRADSIFSRCPGLARCLKENNKDETIYCPCPKCNPRGNAQRERRQYGRETRSYRSDSSDDFESDY